MFSIDTVKLFETYIRYPKLVTIIVIIIFIFSFLFRYVLYSSIPESWHPLILGILVFSGLVLGFKIISYFFRQFLQWLEYRYKIMKTRELWESLDSEKQNIILKLYHEKAMKLRMNALVMWLFDAGIIEPVMNNTPVTMVGNNQASIFKLKPFFAYWLALEVVKR